MKKSRWLILVCALLVLGAVVVYFGDRVPESPDEQAAEPARATGVLEDDAPARPEGAQALDSDTAWVVVDPETVDDLPPYKEVVVGRALVRVSEALRLGGMTDRVVLAVPQLARTYEGVIEEVDVDPWGNVSYVGLLRDLDDRDYRFLITAGPSNTFAHIGTSRGTFELVATGGELGWLMPTANMDQHVDYSKPDYYIVDEKPRLQEDDTAP